MDEIVLEERLLGQKHVGFKFEDIKHKDDTIGMVPRPRFTELEGKVRGRADCALQD